MSKDTDKPRTTATPRRIPAVAYLRRSTQMQEASIEQQRKAVREYADEKGYHILREYKDDGISGDSTDEREGFQQMIADARSLGDFKTIICWDQKRFGRFNSIEYGYYVYPLMKAGITLALVTGEVIDWNNATGRIVANVNQEGAHKDLRDHAANVTRGMGVSLDNGSWVGSIPYAYRLEGRKHNKQLILDDPYKAQVVKRIFREYVGGKSMNAIAGGLDADHIACPGGRVYAAGGTPAWRYDTIKTILENPVYVGDFRGRHYVHAKYNTRGPAGMENTDGKRRCRPESEWVIKRDHHEAVIDRDTFAAAQVRLAKGKTGRSNHYKEDEHPFVLHDLLCCGRCNGPLWGMRGGQGPTVGRSRYYECSNRKHNGKNACPGTTVREDRVLHSVADYLFSEFFDTLDGESLSWRAERKELRPGDLPKAFAKVKALISPPRQPAADRKRMEKQAKDVDTKIEQARRNLAHAKDPENIAIMEDEIGKMKATQDELRTELSKRPPTDKDINAETMEVLRSLYWLAIYFRSSAEQAEMSEEEREELYAEEGEWMITLADPTAALRPYLRKIAGITVYTRIEGHKTRTRHQFERGEIAFKPVGLDTNNLNPHVTG